LCFGVLDVFVESFLLGENDSICLAAVTLSPATADKANALRKLYYCFSSFTKICKTKTKTTLKKSNNKNIRLF
jgi:hypothetical protein